MNSEAPVLEPEPVVEIGSAEAKQPTLVAGTFDRSHWAGRSVGPARGTVVHMPLFSEPAVEDANGSGSFPGEDTVLARDSSLATDALAWFASPVRAVWQVVRLPIAVFFADLPGASSSSPQGDYERAPAPLRSTEGVGFPQPDPIEPVRNE